MVHSLRSLAAILLVVTAACSSNLPARRVGAPAPSGRAPEGALAVATPRQIERDGRMNVEVEQILESRRRLEHAATALDAQVARAESDEKSHASYLLRVPADRLDAMMDSAATLGVTQVRTVSAEDVTDRLVDLEARAAALRASRDRLKTLLDRSTTVQDVVSVERELARVQGELESLEGRLAALQGQVVLAELSVELQRKPVLGPLGVLFSALGTGISKLFIWR